MWCSAARRCVWELSPNLSVWRWSRPHQLFHYSSAYLGFSLQIHQMSCGTPHGCGDVPVFWVRHPWGMTFTNRHQVSTYSPGLSDTFDLHQELSNLLYVDANNLYGHALSMKLPQRDFKWIVLDNFTSIDWSSVDTEGNRGYVLEVEIEYLEAIHDFSLDLPFALERIEPKAEWFSDFMQSYFHHLHPNCKSYPTTSKLILT